MRVVSTEQRTEAAAAAFRISPREALDAAGPLGRSVHFLRLAEQTALLRLRSVDFRPAEEHTEHSAATRTGLRAWVLEKAFGRISGRRLKATEPLRPCVLWRWESSRESSSHLREPRHRVLR